MIKNTLYNVNKIISNLNSIVCKRKSPLDFKDIIYLMSYKEIKHESYQTIRSHFSMINRNDEKKKKITKDAIIKKFNNIDLCYYQNLSHDLTELYYKNNNESRTIAFDGCLINLVKELGEHFRLSKNEKYSTALISSAYDVVNKVPISYGIYEHFDERAAMIDQLGYLKENDIVVVDRGYFSNELLFELYKKNIKVIFRVKKNLKIIKNLKKNTKDIVFNYKINNVDMNMRLIKCEYGKETYFLFTNITDKLCYPKEYFYKMYKSRWGVETDFYYAKKYLSLDNLESKSVDGIKKEIYIHNIIQTLDMILKKELDKPIIKENYKINKRNSLFILGDELLRLMLYGNITKSKIDIITELLGLILKTIVESKPNRSHKREKKRPASRWYTFPKP